MERTTMELKTCELCGRLFARAAVPPVVLTPRGEVSAGRKETICALCIVNPPKEEEEPAMVIRSYRLCRSIRL